MSGNHLGTEDGTAVPTGLLLAVAAFLFVAAWVTWRWPGLWPPRIWDPLHHSSGEGKAQPRRWLPPLVLVVFGVAMLLFALPPDASNPAPIVQATPR